ncbi:hypothetical protein [Cellulomonas phragmiteti]|uniref:Uncharacterized protein n=1 Tax=Cellulomonas phragmiteti TaxID=478780 RepID=A0ABQ4DFV9_9CELL|nr:hypothetical protein [Cellulomonas phragmiteti]GIG38243.1 hypothetical protein Cph01nite_00050 [Cellulomonas phragmiteti]
MTADECSGWVVTLSGETVLYTGTAYVDGGHMERRTLRTHTRRLGGSVAPDRSRAVTVLVHGDLGGRRLTDPERGYSQKLVFVERLMRERGQHVHVIDDRGFENLLHGLSARCHRLRESGGSLLAVPAAVQHVPGMGGC